MKNKQHLKDLIEKFRALPKELQYEVLKEIEKIKEAANANT